MNLEILLFATFADLAGSRKVVIDVAEPCTVSSVVTALQAKLPTLRAYDLRQILVAVNQEIAGPDQTVSASDEVGVFPPVSGG